MNENPNHSSPIQTTEQLGRLVREHRKARKLTLESTSGLANLSVRFLSEFERGKETAEIGKVLKALRTLGLDLVVQPRGAYRTEEKSEGINSQSSSGSDDD